MYFSVVLSLLTVVSFTSAQSLPSCALQCITSADTSGCGGTTDTACLCKDPTFVNSTFQCVQAKCPSSDVSTALSAAQMLCAGAGVSVSLPASSAATGTSNVSNSSASPTPTSQKSANGASASAVNIIAGLIGAGVAALVL
ncbi:hypothetical protein E1B28_005983 [Marasmius oreades]|uniref:CFEM domain-containing protein n=1 Tax=Marasmius oreades TaxID=181124 RepID=A0A9P7UV45_9AGAR|nr:uncharacterized protein E1B28_005983 [Marasmius oreades]KAG7095208.1 hypothetical protein E1B28_005983 [Marasmius oreades]